MEVVLAPVRRRIARSVRSILAGPRVDGPPTGSEDPPTVDGGEAGDPGLFGPDSSTWLVHSDLAMLIGGIRALLLQSLHPLAMAGVARHSDYREDPLGRLQRTGVFIGETTFGDRDAAMRAIASVRAIHRRVVGTTADGRPYSAQDPHLLAWIHVSEVDSFLAAHQRYGTERLPPEAADRYVSEMAVVGRALGARDLPDDVSDLRRALDGFRPELEASPECREAVRFLLAPPLPLRSRPAYGVLFAAAVGLLPGWARGMLRLPTVPGADPLVVRPAATTIMRTLGWALGPSPALEAARARVAGPPPPEPVGV